MASEAFRQAQANVRGGLVVTEQPGPFRDGLAEKRISLVGLVGGQLNERHRFERRGVLEVNPGIARTHRVRAQDLDRKPALALAVGKLGVLEAGLGRSMGRDRSRELSRSRRAAVFAE